MSQQQADPRKLGYVGSLDTRRRDSDSWFTPAKYAVAVRKTLGRIDLDPFSSHAANETIRARNYFTLERGEDAFLNDWRQFGASTCFMNPPYSRGLCSAAISRFLFMMEAGAFSRGILLLNNATDTKWFHQLRPYTHALCFTDHRISFENVDGKSVSGNTRGQMFIFVASSLKRGPNARSKFRRNFESFGWVL